MRSAPRPVAQAAVRQNLGSLVFDAVMVADRVAALDTAGSQMDPVAVKRDCALAFPAVAHRTRMIHFWWRKSRRVRATRNSSLAIVCISDLGAQSNQRPAVLSCKTPGYLPRLLKLRHDPIPLRSAQDLSEVMLQCYATLRRLSDHLC